MNETILVTGSAGFIGSSLISKLLEKTNDVIIGIDNICPYYDIKFKYKNLDRNKSERFINYITDICSKKEIDEIFNNHHIDKVYHLAAQAGVRYSIEHPIEVINTNVIGFQNIIQNVINHNIRKLVYASSSSVYGDMNVNNEENPCNSQLSPYAMTKKTNELIAQLYSNLYPELQLSGLRFFTVYGPYMRPDLAIGKFTKAILSNKPIEIYGDGAKERDFTYIDDIVHIMMTIMNSNKQWNHEIFNIGYGKCTSINKIVQTIKEYINPQFDKIIYLDDAQGDVKKTLANNQKIKEWFGESPQIEIHNGIQNYVNWFRNYLRI